MKPLSDNFDNETILDAELSIPTENAAHFWEISDLAFDELMLSVAMPEMFE